MRGVPLGGQNYKLPNSLNAFQQEMYVHLINWKWQYITRAPGEDGGHEYDAILPDAYADKYPMLYPDIKDAFIEHLQKFPFRVHKYFNHMASSQAANANLFLPILLHPNANAILAFLKPDFTRIAKSQLDSGYRIEFWDEGFGNLNDKTAVSGTDSDLAIAYYNHQDELCLWLIEHKLTEDEFTQCKGSKSKGRQAKHDCSRSFSELLEDKSTCYLHDVRKFNYWNITETSQAFFANHARQAICPFQGGMYQLWRNQLLGLSIEQDDRQPYQEVYFSVVKHPRNTHLNRSLSSYTELIADNPRFSVFTSTDVVSAAAVCAAPELDHWIGWYCDLYNL